MSFDVTSVAAIKPDGTPVVRMTTTPHDSSQGQRQVIDMTPGAALQIAQEIVTAAMTATGMTKIPDAVSTGELKAAAQGGIYLPLTSGAATA